VRQSFACHPFSGTQLANPRTQSNKEGIFFLALERIIKWQLPLRGLALG